MQVIEPVETMQLICKRLTREGKTIRLIPTMGSLHAGHASLIKRAIEDKADGYATASTRQLDGSAHKPTDGDGRCGGAAGERDKSVKRPAAAATVVVVSIFVNPLQFSERDDFVKYPNNREHDLALCKRLNVDYIFAPNCREFLGDFNGGSGSRKVSVASVNSNNKYSSQLSRCATLSPPGELAQDLEGRSRPNHFEGMLTIVCKLFNVVQPDRAYFGEKDYQQLVLVDKMVRDLNMAVRICSVETEREEGSNLPLSSRNGRLTGEQRLTAANVMFNALMDGKRCLEQKCRRSTYDDSNGGEPPDFELETMLLSSLLAAQSCSLPADEDAVGVDYFEVRCAKDLSVIEFNQALNLYDCKMCCVSRRLLDTPSDCCLWDDDDDDDDDAKILEARLLISVLIARVRLLDNMNVRLNL